MERPAFVRIPSTSRWASRIAWAAGFWPVEISDRAMLTRSPMGGNSGTVRYAMYPAPASLSTAPCRAPISVPPQLYFWRYAGLPRTPAPGPRGIDPRRGNPPHHLFRRGPLDELPRDLFLLGARRNLKPMDCGLGEASRGPSRRQREPHPILDLALGWVCGQPDPSESVDVNGRAPLHHAARRLRLRVALHAGHAEFSVQPSEDLGGLDGLGGGEQRSHVAGRIGEEPAAVGEEVVRPDPVEATQTPPPVR